MPSPAPACLTKLTAFSVISTKPTPRVSTCNVALAISCGTASAMVGMRRGMDRVAQRSSAFLHHVLLHGADHLDQTVPGLLDEVAGARDILVRRQLDDDVVALPGRCQICRRPRRRRLFQRCNFLPERSNFAMQAHN